jgi:membrane-bound lytic murein transglycosylase B
MARKQRQKQNSISDEMEARINSASESELQTIMAEAGHQYESAKEHSETDPDICAAKLTVKELTATDREDMKAARAISKRAHAEQLSRGHKVEIRAKVAKGPLFPPGSDGE